MFDLSKFSDKNGIHLDIKIYEHKTEPSHFALLEIKSWGENTPKILRKLEEELERSHITSVIKNEAGTQLSIQYRSGNWRARHKEFAQELERQIKSACYTENVEFTSIRKTYKQGIGGKWEETNCVW